MGTKSRLFASAAFPLLSLSLIMQPAAASAAVAAKAVENRIAPAAIAGSYQLAQESSEEELKKKAKEQAPAEQPEAPAAPKEAPAEAKPAPAAEAPKQLEAPAAAAAPEPQAEAPQKKHKSPEAAPAAAEQPEAPKAEKPKADAEPRQPEAAPQAEQAQPAQVQPEQPAQGGEKRPREHGRDKSKNGEAKQQPADAPAQQPATEMPAQQPAAETPAQPQVEQPPAEQPKAEKPKSDKPKSDKANADKPKTEQAQPDQPKVTEPKATETKPAEPAIPEQKPAPDKAATPETAPVQPKADAQQPTVAPTQPAANPAPQTPPAKGQPSQDQQAKPQPQALPDASGGQQAEQAIPAPEKVTPKELERRKQIALDPSKSSETVVLPVENGAAVLDSDKDADHSNGQQGRRDRDKQRASEQQMKVPTSDADAQAQSGGQKRQPVKIEAVTSEEGKRLDRRPDFDAPDGARLGERRDDNRVILQFDNRSYVRSDDDSRFLQDGERPSYEQLSRDRYRETIDRPEGSRIVTIRNRYGDIIQRSRIDSRGREYVLYYSPELSDDPDQDYFQDPGADLPPMRLRIPVRDYIIDTSSDPDRDYYDFLREPPVEPVERVYSLNEVKYSARIRDKVRRIDLDTITFATGSAEIPMSQAKTLKKVADAIGEVLKKDPSETFLIEGHTDAVGSDQSNLILSDQRAESIASLLSDVYGIAPENLATQGYGERYLKVNTSGPEQENRRVTIRRVTPLVRPVASRN